MALSNRPKISVYIAMSLDGFIAGENGDLYWLSSVQIPDEDYGYSKFFASVDAIVMGRKTYEKVVKFGGSLYEGKKLIVVSTTLESVQGDTELCRGDIIELAKRLHAQGIKHIYVDGGVTISKFLNAGMVDFITLSIVPIILGSGVPLFDEIHSKIPTYLVSTKSYSSGLIQLNYKLVK